MSAIAVSNLTKTFRVHHKDPGLKGSFRALFHRQYHTITAVNQVSFNIKQGELVGFIGPNGAGKTSTLKCLSGLLYPTSGQVSVLGFTPHERIPEFQRQFSLVMGQKNQLWWDLPAIETFLLHKEIYQIPDSRFEKTLDHLVQLLDVASILKVQVRKLSLGQRMKCELIAALLHQPKILFLDEPTIGLDVVMQKAMRDFIKVYNRDYQATIILTSHYMDDVKELCDRVILIDQGRLLFDGKLNAIIDKYATRKTLTVTFSKPVTSKSLELIGEVSSFIPPTAKIVVDRNLATKKAAQLLSKFPVADINIEEPSIEAIIRRLFKDNHNQL